MNLFTGQADVCGRPARAVDGSDRPDRFENSYFTPPEHVFQLLDRERFDGPVWEPACGDGAISGVLASLGHEVVSTDIHDYGYPAQLRRLDFLKESPDFGFHHIVTNPPYLGNVIRPWVRRCCQYRPRKVALLLQVDCLVNFTDRSVTGPDMRLSWMIVLPRRGAKFTRVDGAKFMPRWPVCWFVLERGFRGEARFVDLG